jgi:RNA polymerase sigma-70 factor (ECF subfamily)
VNKKDFNEVVEENTAFVRSIVRKFVKNPETAKDLTQEIFLKAYQNYERYSEDGKIKAWLSVISHNMLKDHYKAEQYQSNHVVLSPLEYVSDELMPSTENPEDIVIERELLDETTKIINTLPEKQRDIIIYSYFYDYSDKEIASIQNMTLSAVKSSKHFGLQKVRKLIGAEDGAEAAANQKHKLNNKFGRYRMIKCYTCGDGKFTEDTKLQSDSIIELISPSQNEIAGVTKFLKDSSASEYNVKALIDGDFDKVGANIDTRIVAAKLNDCLNVMISSDYIILCHDNLEGAQKELIQSIQGIWASFRVPGAINLDYADIYNLLSRRKNIYTGTSKNKGEGKLSAGLSAISSSPLLADNIKSSPGLIVCMTACPEISLDDIDVIMSDIHKKAAPDASIVFAVAFDGEMDDEIIVSVMATDKKMGSGF